MAITGLDEVSHLFSRVRINDAAELWRSPGRPAQQAALISDDANRDAFDVGISRNHLFRIIGLKLIQLAAVDQASQHISHIIGEAMVSRNDVVDICQGTSWRTG